MEYAMVAKALWPRVERKVSIELPALTKAHIAAMIGVLTEHYPSGTDAVGLKILEDAN